MDRALIVRLATQSRAGLPLVTPLWFVRDGAKIIIGTRRGSPHARNAFANPSVVMTFGDRHGRPTRRVLRAFGTARVADYEEMTTMHKVKLAWRYFLQPASIVHWLGNWRKIGMRNRYYSERTDPSMLEITLERAEFVARPVAVEEIT
jgi:nitroimidazol reductase NimA-like FMN-containing flavoprotein (pyridoxamine 5'-phosphate oxidase superfamily)